MIRTTELTGFLESYDVTQIVTPSGKVIIRCKFEGHTDLVRPNGSVYFRNEDEVDEAIAKFEEADQAEH
jgi:hypothetical protein